MNQVVKVSLMMLLMMSAAVRAAVSPAELFEKVSPSLVAVQYTWASELQRLELTVPGVVVSDDGLIMVSIASFSPIIPETQLVDFKVLVPTKDGDPDELEAVYQGRDERASVAYIKLKDASKKLPAVKFEDKPVKLGSKIYSVGLLPKSAGYRAYISESIAAGFLRGESKQVLVTGAGLTAIGSPVFNEDGTAIGYVNLQVGKSFLLDTSNERAKQGLQPMVSVEDAPHLFTPANEFLFSITDHPTPGNPVKLPWLGIPQLSGLKSEVAAVFGLGKQAAIEIGDIVPASPAEKAGLKVGGKIIKVNGEALERGDEPDELPQIMARKLTRFKPGAEITLSIVTEKDKPAEDVKLTLGERPKLASDAKRFFADDLGFVARDVVFEDAYRRKLPADSKGVAIALIRPSGAAQSAKLANGDMVTSFNNAPTTDVEQFKKDYEAFRKEKPSEPIVLVVMKQDASTETIRIEPPR